VTVIDGLLACAVLVGLVLSALADPVAALVIVFCGAREGWRALSEAAG
jgi:divalent metal cation (Fe/Co/Zn/Cd) transporter